jgi:voltage-gated potassium channel Kch
MKFLDWLTGTKRPAAGVPAKMPAEVRADLLAVNRPTAPFIVRDGAPENVDIVAEWRIVDATWYEIFAKAGLQKIFKVLIKLDARAREVRAVDQEWSVEWRAGVPTLSLATEAFRGQTKEFSFGTAFAFTEEGSFGKVYRYKFSTAEIKTPLQDAVTKAGWTWRGVSFGKL